MGKKKLQRLTLDNIIAKKLEREKNEIKFKDIEVPSLGGTILFNKPDDDSVLETFEKIKDHEDDLRLLDEAYTDLIYSSCPTFKEIFNNKSLEDITVPTDVVKSILILSDRLQIGNELIEMTNLGKSNAGEEIKK